MVHADFSHLTIDSALKDLPSYAAAIRGSATGQEVFTMLDDDPLLPGVMVMKERLLVGVVPREVFFEKTGRAFDNEVFLQRSIQVLLDTLDDTYLVLPETMSIADATQQALERSIDDIYHPIVIRRADNSHRLISTLMLFQAQNAILHSLKKQRAFTIDSGLNLSDDEALLRFRRFANIGSGQARDNLLNRHTVRCDHCSQLISYTIPDIVRSHPQLSKGMEISDRMGSRFYLFYIRHQCTQGELREIPVQHDQNLEYRSQRPSRVLDSYV